MLPLRAPPQLKLPEKISSTFSPSAAIWVSAMDFAPANTHHRDHGADADDDAQRGEIGTLVFLRNRAERYSKSGGGRMVGRESIESEFRRRFGVAPVSFLRGDEPSLYLDIADCTIPAPVRLRLQYCAMSRFVGDHHDGDT